MDSDYYMTASIIYLISYILGYSRLWYNIAMTSQILYRCPLFLVSTYLLSWQDGGHNI